MKKTVSLIVAAVMLCLVLVSCDLTKLDGLKVISYIDSDAKKSGDLYKSAYVKDSLDNDARRYKYSGKSGGSEFCRRFDNSGYYLTDISGYNGIFMIVSNPTDKPSPAISLSIFDFSDISNYSALSTGLMDFAGNVVYKPTENYVNIPEGFYGLLYCDFDSLEFGEQMSSNRRFALGFSIKPPADGESDYIDTYSALMYKTSEPVEAFMSIGHTDITHGATKPLQGFEGGVTSDFAAQTHAAHVFVSSFAGGVISGEKSLLITNSSNNNDARLSKYTEGDKMPVIAGSSLAGLDYTMNTFDPCGMYFLVSIPDNYSEQGRKSQRINMTVTLSSGGARVELPSSSMSFYADGGTRKPSDSLSGVDVPIGSRGLVYASFDEAEIPDGWDWTNVSAEIGITGVKYERSGYTAYNNRDIIIDDFTAVYDENIPVSLRLHSYDALSVKTGESFGEVSVIVTNANGLPVEGIEVTFELPKSGATATADSYTARTGAAGIASVKLTANDQVGSYDMIMRAGELVDSVQLHNLAPDREDAETDGNGGGRSSPLIYIIIAAAAVVLTVGLVLLSKQGKDNSK